MHIPKQYWVHVILTTCYLINRMSSSMLNNQVPFSMLHPGVSPFSLPPRVFGCVAFVCNLKPNQDTLALRSLKCVSLGYPRTQKNYHCYNPQSRKYYVSSDVSFFESTPVFPSGNETDAGWQSDKHRDNNSFLFKGNIAAS